MEKDIHDEQRIKRMPAKRTASIRKIPKTQEEVEGLVDAIQAIGLEEFMDYIRSPWKDNTSANFIAGVAGVLEHS